MKKITVLVLLCLSFALSCERDDLCSEDTPTTPKLIIDFLSASDLSSSKNVPLLAVKGVGNTSILESFKGVTSSQVALPLKTDDNSTQFSLYNDSELNDEGTTIVGGNEDIITITYATEEVYVSRACGFKTIFKDVAIQVENDGDNWIQIVLPSNDNQSVEDETTTHFNIFH